MMHVFEMWVKISGIWHENGDNLFVKQFHILNILFSSFMIRNSKWLCVSAFSFLYFSQRVLLTTIFTILIIFHFNVLYQQRLSFIVCRHHAFTLRRKVIKKFDLKIRNATKITFVVLKITFLNINKCLLSVSNTIYSHFLDTNKKIDMAYP